MGFTHQMYFNGQAHSNNRGVDVLFNPFCFPRFSIYGLNKGLHTGCYVTNRCGTKLLKRGSQRGIYITNWSDQRAFTTWQEFQNVTKKYL